MGALRSFFHVNSDTCNFELNNNHFNAGEVAFLDSEISWLVLLDYTEQCSVKSRTSDGGNGNHSVSLPIILIKIKVNQMLQSS